MKLIIIAALNNKRVIGKDGKIPWHVSEDLKRFKRLTLGHVVLMGRKSFESLGKPLPGRRNVVLTSRKITGVETFTSIDAALAALKDQGKVYVIGGGEIFKLFLERADEMCLTLIDNNIEGDTFFPRYDHLIGTKYRLIKEEKHEGYSFKDYSRIELS